MRPLLRNMGISYLDIKEGRVDLADLALLNDVLDASDENERRVQEANRGDHH